jgi:imidazoleglycerol phosphate dehydratase HisB
MSESNKLQTISRKARVDRKTSETEVSVQLDLDGTGCSEIQTV